MLVCTDKLLRLSSRWRHIHLLFADLVGILLLPALVLRRPELSGSKTAFLAVFHAEIFLLGLVLPLSYNTIINAGYADTATSAMDSMEVQDDSHIVLHFDFEYGPALECVSSDYMVIFPENAYESESDFGRNPVGTGAYKFVEWNTGDRIVLTANEDYYKGTPSIKDVTFRIQPDNSVATLGLENGEIDVHTKVPQTDVPNVQANPDLQYDETLGNATTWIIFNFDGIFADENLRLAVAHAIDKEGAMMGAIEGQGAVAQAIYANFVPGYDFDYEGPAYDPDLSRELLAEAGYPDGLDLTVKKDNRKPAGFSLRHYDGG